MAQDGGITDGAIEAERVLACGSRPIRSMAIDPWRAFPPTRVYPDGLAPDRAGW